MITTREEQIAWAVEYLAGNLSPAEAKNGEASITVQAFADFFDARWPGVFNKMQFAAKVRRRAEDK